MGNPARHFICFSDHSWTDPGYERPLTSRFMTPFKTFLGLAKPWTWRARKNTGWPSSWKYPKSFERSRKRGLAGTRATRCALPPRKSGCTSSKTVTSSARSGGTGVRTVTPFYFLRAFCTFKRQYFLLVIQGRALRYPKARPWVINHH